MATLQYTDVWMLLQKDVFAVLQADAFIGQRPGVLIEPGDTTSEINEQVTMILGEGSDGKTGVGFLVLPIEKASDEDVSNPFGPMKLTVAVQFVENVVINQGSLGTGIPIRIYAARAAKILKLYTPVGLTQNLVSQDPVISEFTDKDDEDRRIGHIEFYAREADGVPLARLPRPQISVSGGAYPYTVTVTPPTAAVNTYYTTDGSHPWENNSRAQVVSGPITITGPGLFRVRSFGADGDFNTIPSDTNAFNFP